MTFFHSFGCLSTYSFSLWADLGPFEPILTNIDQTFTKKHKKIQTHVFFQKGMSNKKEKAPAALVSVANMGWGYQY